MKISRARVIVALAATVVLASSARVPARSSDGQTRNGPGDAAGFHLSIYHPMKGSGDGSNPVAPVIKASDGNFYGTTTAGGSANLGTVFRMTPAGVTTVVHSFTGADGSLPRGALLQAGDGNLYGTTYTGGASNLGTVFKMTLAGTFTTIYSFVGGTTDGASPRAALIQASNGNLYGTTEFGGTANRGSAFGMTLAGSVTVRYFFSGGDDGAYPYAPLIQATDGNLYGTAYAGDVATFGRVFQMTPAGAVTVLHTFVSGATDGASPLTALIQATDGNFYGTTHLGGTTDSGTVFKITLAGVVTLLKVFTGGADGANPDGTLVQGADGNLYGTTRVGASGYGTAFRLALDGTGFTVIHTFTGASDGADPSAGLLQTSDGNFWGTAEFGGAAGLGLVFRMTTAAATPFTDDTLTVGTTPIRAVHITELRSRVDALRTRFGLSAFAYTDPTLTVGMTMVAAAHINDLRNALGQAYDAVGVGRPNYADATLDVGVMAIKAVHITELRAAVQNIE